MLRIKRHFTINRFLDRLIREPMDNEEEEFFDDNDSDVLDNEIGSRHNFQRLTIQKTELSFLSRQKTCHRTFFLSRKTSNHFAIVASLRSATFSKIK